MFYSTEILSYKNKTALALLYHVSTTSLATRKISKKDIISYNIIQSIDQLKNPPQAFSLKLYSILFKGIVRIYFLKIQYIWSDLNFLDKKIYKKNNKNNNNKKSKRVKKTSLFFNINKISLKSFENEFDLMASECVKAIVAEDFLLPDTSPERIMNVHISFNNSIETTKFCSDYFLFILDERKTLYLLKNFRFTIDEISQCNIKNLLNTIFDSKEFNCTFNSENNYNDTNLSNHFAMLDHLNVENINKVSEYINAPNYILNSKNTKKQEKDLFFDGKIVNNQNNKLVENQTEQLKSLNCEFLKNNSNFSMQSHNNHSKEYYSSTFNIFVMSFLKFLGLRYNLNNKTTFQQSKEIQNQKSESYCNFAFLVINKNRVMESDFIISPLSNLDNIFLVTLKNPAISKSNLQDKTKNELFFENLKSFSIPIDISNIEKNIFYEIFKKFEKSKSIKISSPAMFETEKARQYSNLSNLEQNVNEFYNFDLFDNDVNNIKKFCRIKDKNILLHWNELTFKIKDKLKENLYDEFSFNIDTIQKKQFFIQNIQEKASNKNQMCEFIKFAIELINRIYNLIFALISKYPGQKSDMKEFQIDISKDKSKIHKSNCIMDNIHHNIEVGDSHSNQNDLNIYSQYYTDYKISLEIIYIHYKEFTQKTNLILENMHKNIFLTDTNDDFIYKDFILAFENLILHTKNRIPYFGANNAKKILEILFNIIEIICFIINTFYLSKCHHQENIIESKLTSFLQNIKKRDKVLYKNKLLADILKNYEFEQQFFNYNFLYSIDESKLILLRELHLLTAIICDISSKINNQKKEMKTFMKFLDFIKLFLECPYKENEDIMDLRNYKITNLNNSEKHFFYKNMSENNELNEILEFHLNYKDNSNVFHEDYHNYSLKSANKRLKIYKNYNFNNIHIMKKMHAVFQNYKSERNEKEHDIEFYDADLNIIDDVSYNLSYGPHHELNNDYKNIEINKNIDFNTQIKFLKRKRKVEAFIKLLDGIGKGEYSIKQLEAYSTIEIY